MGLDRLFANSLDRYRNRLCLACPGHGQKSYGDVIEEADGFQRKLPASKQLVFIDALNAMPSVVAYLGALRAGHAVHLLDPDKEDDNGALIETYDPNILVRCDQDVHEIELRHDRNLHIHPELAILLSTSGSTGSRKLVKLSRTNIQSNTEAIVDYLGMNEDDKTVTSLKFHYSYGMSIINMHLAAGGAIVLTNRSVQEQAFWDLCKDYGATNFSGVPYTYEMIDKLGVDFSDFPHLRFLTQAGGKLDQGLVRRYATLGDQQGWLFYVMYGQTEAAPRMSYLPPDKAQEHPDCIGVAIPGGRLSLVDEDHNAIDAVGQEGELVYEGPNVMMGYAESHRDLVTKDDIERLYTGDLAIRNDAGLFRITGRQGRFIKPYGLRVSLDDIQDFVGQHGVRAFVIGRDRQIVICTEHREIDKEMLPLLADTYQLPVSLFRRQKVDSVPLLSNGKVDYRSLQSTFLTDEPENTSTSHFLIEFPRQFWAELSALLIGGSHNWSGVQEIFEVHFRGKTPTPESSFISLGGDSLLYVEMSVCLQEHLEYLPNKWQYRSISELQSMASEYRA